MTSSPTPAVLPDARALFAQIAECAFDDRPRSRVGHPSHMDWEDGYREGTQAAAAAIRAAPKVASDAGAGKVAIPRDAFDHVVGMLHNAGFHSTAECFAALATDATDVATGGGDLRS